MEDERGICRLALAYKAKGASAVHSMMLGRLQMYHAVYWHHAVRAIQSMFIHCIASTFEGLAPSKERKYRNISVEGHTVSDIFYYMVICGKSFNESITSSKGGRQLLALNRDIVPPEISAFRSLEFVWRLSEDRDRRLLERLVRREIYKRVFEIRVGDIGGNTEFSAIKAELNPTKRVRLATELEELFLNTINRKMVDRAGRTDTTSELAARTRMTTLRTHEVPRVVIDFPTRGISEELNWPQEIGDPARKYLGSPQRGKHPDNVFTVVRKMQLDMASVRIFAAPELHELVIRYLDPADVRVCVDSVIPLLRTTH